MLNIYMPEGPEACILANYLRYSIKNKNFTSITSNTKTTRNLPKESKVLDVYSKGKVIIIKTEDYYIHIHLGITGWLLDDKPKIYKYILHFENRDFYLGDTRRFSSIKILNNEEDNNKELNKTGVDILSENFTIEYFKNKIKSKKANICAVLLDQKIFAGLGNYIKNDALYLAKISPKRKTNAIEDQELDLLFEKIKFVTFSNLYDWFDSYELKVPKKIKELKPEKIKKNYKFYVYNREKDNKGNPVTYIKNLCGRRTFYVESIQL